MTQPTQKPSEAPNPYASPLDLRHMLDQDAPELTHVLPGLLAGTVGALVAPGGTGKTMFLLQTACAVATGRPLCDGLFDDVPPDCAMSPEPQRVVLVVAEEPPDVMWHRLRTARDALLGTRYPLLDRPALEDLLVQNLHVHALLGRPGATLINGDRDRTRALAQLTVSCKGASLVMLDPLRQFHQLDENDSAAMSAVIQGLQSLAATTGASVILAHHTNRASTNLGLGNTAGAARGSTALTDGVRWQLNLSPPAGDFARDNGIALGDQGQFLRVDFAKVNYLPPLAPRVLKRGAGGVLTLYRPDVSDATQAPRAPKRLATRAAPRARRPA